MPEETGYDFSALTVFAEGDEDARRNILETFSHELSLQIEEMKEAKGRGDGGAVSRMAHKWQPVFAMLKLSDMLPLLTRLEEEGADRWDDELSELLVRVLSQAEQIQTAIALLLLKER